MTDGSHQRIESRQMRGWEINEYGGINSLRFSDSLKLPVIRSPHDLLIEVFTTAVNPLDQLMTGLLTLNLISLILNLT